MINLPLLDSLDVNNYGLYPGGHHDTPSLHVDFHPGLTLILGANGLGKSTLVTMLYRLMTGPFEIPALLQDGDLGTARLRVTPLRRNLERGFAQRVADNAAQAYARIVFYLAGEEVSVERNLRNLTLRSFRVGDSPPSDNEEEYQNEISRLANVYTFGDWILLLRYIVYYFEDRRSLVWDPTAQRQLLRILFLERESSQYWREREREILETESDVRNLRVHRTREARSLNQDEALLAGATDIQSELQKLDDDQRSAKESLDEVSSQLLDINVRREDSRLQFLTLQQRRESQYRELENAHLIAVNARLPQASASARYILSHLLTESECLLCGNNAPSIVESMESRMRSESCIVCGSHLNSDLDHTPVNLADERIRSFESQLRKVDVELEAARINLDESEGDRSRAVTRRQQLEARIAENERRMDSLLEQLPPEEAEVHERRRELASIQSRIDGLQSDLDRMHSEFEQVIESANAVVTQSTLDVRKYFGSYAHEFLVEDCELVWSPRREQLGQLGRRFEFPAFGLDLGGSGFGGTTRRTGPEDVSESQREFIDIAFRMALAMVATKQQATSLVMDAPESSLDTIFVGRAARVLGKFGRRETGNRLVVTSNLIVGDLIPTLLTEAADQDDRLRRVVDLLRVAAPTGAVEHFRNEYENARDNLLKQANAT